MSKKTFKDHFNVAQLGNHGPSHADDNARKLKQTVLGARAAMARYQQEFCRKFTPSEQM